MRWLFLSSVVGCSVLGGCMHEKPYATPPAAGVARSQKSDPPSPPPRGNSFLDVLPDRPADATSGEVAARIRATVNGVPIFDEEVQANAYQFFVLLRDVPEPERTRKH